MTINRISINSVLGKGTLRLLTEAERKRVSPNHPHVLRVGFFPPRAKTPKLVFRLDECFDEHGNFFEEAVS